MFLLNSYTKLLSSKALGKAIHYNALLIIKVGGCLWLTSVWPLPPATLPRCSCSLHSFTSDLNKRYLCVTCIMRLRASVNTGGLDLTHIPESFGTSGS